MCQSIYLKLVEACVSVHLSQTHGSLCVCPFTVFPRIEDGFFSFQNNPKDLDPSYKTDLDL